MYRDTDVLVPTIVWRTQRGNQKSYIEEGQIIQCKKKDTRTKHYVQNATQKINNLATQTKLKFSSELRCPGKINGFCPICGTRRDTLLTNPVISHEWGTHRIMIMTNGTHLWSFVTHIVTHIFRNCGDRKTLKWWFQLNH